MVYWLLFCFPIPFLYASTFIVMYLAFFVLLHCLLYCVRFCFSLSFFIALRLQRLCLLPYIHASLASTPVLTFLCVFPPLWLLTNFNLELNFESRKDLEARPALPPNGAKTGHKSRSRLVIRFISLIFRVTLLFFSRFSLVSLSSRIKCRNFRVFLPCLLVASGSLSAQGVAKSG